MIHGILSILLKLSVEMETVYLSFEFTGKN